MKKAIKMLVLDMAGTTVNENNIVYKTLQTAINIVGNYQLSLGDVLKHGAGKEKLQAIRTVLKNCLDVDDDKLALQIFEVFRKELKVAYKEQEIYPNAHAEQLFAALKERELIGVLNTGYDRQTAEFLMKKLNWKVGRDVDALITATDVTKGRPEPDMIDLARTKFGISDAAQVIKIGDSIIDIEEGRCAGCALSIGITTGAHTAVQLKQADADYILDDLLEIISIIDRYNTGILQPLDIHSKTFDGKTQENWIHSEKA